MIIESTSAKRLFATWCVILTMTSSFGLRDARGEGSAVGDRIITPEMRPPGTPEGFLIIEGDILVREEEWETFSFESTMVWPDGIVPFEFGSGVNSSEELQMKQGMTAVWGTGANIQFKYRDNEPAYVLIKQATDGTSSSEVGWTGGERNLEILNSQWTATYTVAHELMHVLGFHHEQGRPDRDDFIIIHWDRMYEGAGLNNFAIYPNTETFDIPYDYTSIMHYSACASSECSNCNPLDPFDSPCFTIEALQTVYQTLMGNRDQFGQYDDDDLKAAYGVGTVHYVEAGGNASFYGTIAQPWPLAHAVDEGGTLWLKGESYEFTGVMSEPALLKAHGGDALIGDL